MRRMRAAVAVAGLAMLTACSAGGGDIDPTLQGEDLVEQIILHRVSGDPASQLGREDAIEFVAQVTDYYHFAWVAAQSGDVDCLRQFGPAGMVTGETIDESKLYALPIQAEGRIPPITTPVADSEWKAWGNELALCDQATPDRLPTEPSPLGITNRERTWIEAVLFSS